MPFSSCSMVKMASFHLWTCFTNDAQAHCATMPLEWIKKRKGKKVGCVQKREREMKGGVSFIMRLAIDSSFSSILFVPFSFFF